MTSPDFSRLPYGFDEFPRATPAQWQQAAGRVEPWRSPEGIDHRPLYTAADVQGIPHLGSLPGLPPFLGGPYATMFAQKPWTIRQYARFRGNARAWEVLRAASAGRRRRRRCTAR